MSELYDQEKTKQLDELKSLAEVDFSVGKEEPILEEPAIKKKQKQRLLVKLKKNWQSFSRKKKLAVGFLFVFLLATITVGTILILKSQEEEAKPKKEVEQLIIKDNYSYKDGVLTFLGANNEELGQYTCKNKEEALCYVAYISGEDSFDVPSLVDEDGQKLKFRTKIYHDKYVFVYDNKEADKGVVTLYNMATKEAESYYQLVKSYNITALNYVILKNSDGQYGLVEITKSGISQKIDFKYDYMGIIAGQTTTDKYVVIKSADKWYLADYSGKIKTSGLKYPVKGYNDKYLKIIDDSNAYLVVDYSGEMIAKDLKYVYLMADYYLYVNNDNKLYIKDFTNAKMIEDGLVLFNNDYLATMIYDKNGQLIETKYAFNVIDLDETLKVNIKDSSEDGKIININLAEGNLSKTLSFYSYFAGKLYFYEDDDKERLIGSYLCTNPNNDVANGLKSCYPASDTRYEANEVEPTTNRQAMIPIFNQRYVFVYDSPAFAEAKDISIRLYDLESSKVKGTYASVNSYTPDNAGTLKHINSSIAKIVAKNRSNKFGMIEISSTGVTSIYDFSYLAMEKLGEYILAQSSNGKWKLLIEGTISTVEFEGKIINYTDNYLKVVQNKRYYVFDYEGNQVLDTSYRYVDLFENYVAVVDDSNKVTLYDYHNVNVITGRLSLNSSVYFGTNQPAYRVTFNNNEVTIAILDGSVYTNYKYDLGTGSLIP